MTIDKTIEFFNGLECYTPQAKDARDVAIDTMRKYQRLQADYENLLKADFVVMLEDLQSKIEKTAKEEAQIDEKWANGLRYSEKIIQQKINSLRGGK